MPAKHILLVLALAAAATAQQPIVVPATYATTDAVSYEWVAGASRPLRQQTLIGESHLASMLNRRMTTLELRRTAANETYLGGETHLTVHLSYAPHTPLAGSNAFAANIGTGRTLVFQGNVTIPESPPELGPDVAWTPNNVIRIEFQTPFLYEGGTLCIDIVGAPVPGKNANWWMADAEWEVLTGVTTELGGGCGTYGGPQKKWSFVTPGTLLPGAYAQFKAFGPAGSIGVLGLGQRNPSPIPLAALGLPAQPSCLLHLATVDMLAVAAFVPETHPALIQFGGRAEVRLKLPNDPLLLGIGMTAQWIEWSQMATSNAVEWTMAAGAPTLNMALLEGHPNGLTGELSVHLAHIMRFEFY